MKHSTLTKYVLYYIFDAILLLRTIDLKNSVEHLHSIRVSLRLVRSLLQLYIGEPTLFPTPLKSFLKATNFIRELDVLLLSLHQHLSQSGIKRLTALRNERYNVLFNEESKMQAIQALDEFYDLITNFNPTFTNDYLIQTANKHYKKSLKRYVALVPSASQKELHTLRIRFKISHYAFDFLHDSGLHDSNEKIETSKGMQNQLGEIHDLFNQIALLETLQKQNPSLRLKKHIAKREKELKHLTK